MKRYAIVSVWEKEGVLPFVELLVQQGITILSTGGTAKHLRDNGVPVVSVEEYTAQQEIMDGRVKTLHPKVHAGILARRDREDDVAALTQLDAGVIDFVIVNLYPFTNKVAECEASGKQESLVEFIDIGGPTMLRAAAKNNEFVVPVCHPADYDRIAAELRDSQSVSIELRRDLASRVFRTMSAYDGAIARYFSLQEQLLDADGAPQSVAGVETFALERVMELRYGENPHQRAGLFREVVIGGEAKAGWRQLQGKELSYNNLLDMHGALGLFLEVASGRDDTEHTAVIIKHSNPCGVAVRPSNTEAFSVARACDPLSAFGGIIAVTGEVSGELASTILEGFVELVLASSFSEEALSAFKAKKNVRLLECDFELLQRRASAGELVIRNAFGDYLVQTSDTQLCDMQTATIASAKQPDEAIRSDAKLAWQICKHVKSNTIVIVKDGVAVGIGAGQMSRVDAARFALARAAAHGHNVDGAVAASDAFLPFPDTLEVLNDGGVHALVQPGGSIKDTEVIAAADARDMVMFLTGERHFRH